VSHPRKYGAPQELSLEGLQAWINQVEDLYGRATAIHTNKVSKMTILTADFDLPKPGPAQLRMGHLPGGGSPLAGQAYILGQVMDVTIFR
jgi:hypothetical protein